jgi:hypothetical protein
MGAEGIINNIRVSPCHRILVVEDHQNFIVFDANQMQETFHKRVLNPVTTYLTSEICFLKFDSEEARASQSILLPRLSMAKKYTEGAVIHDSAINFDHLGENGCDAALDFTSIDPI